MEWENHLNRQRDRLREAEAARLGLEAVRAARRPRRWREVARALVAWLRSRRPGGYNPGRRPIPARAPAVHRRTVKP